MNPTGEQGKSMKRVLGKSGIEVSAVGIGCWAIGGVWTFAGSPAGWSEVDDAESVEGIRRALELGVTFFDTAANYGCGHSERVLGQALAGQRDEVVIATKFGHKVDPEAKDVTLYGESEEESDVVSHVRSDLEASLRNLGTDFVDLYQLHTWGLSVDRALEVRDVLEDLIAEGKIRTYGWSTDRPDAIEAFSGGPGAGACQQELNVMSGNHEILDVCERMGLASINRSPLGMGILTGKFSSGTRFAADDVRGSAEWFPGLEDGRVSAEWLEALDGVRSILTSGGRSLAQGAIAWIWAKSDVTVPIPGFKSVAQIEENAGAMAHGPLTAEQMVEIDSILGR